MSAQWFVIRAVAGQEKKVKAYLESEIQRLKLEHLIHQILIPQEKVYEIKDGKKKVKERSFLPGYILIEAETQTSTFVESGKEKTKVELQPEVMSAIKDVPGVVGFVGSERGKTPIPLRESEVNKILRKEEEVEQEGEVLQNPFVVGESVKIMDGPFSGFTAYIDEIFEDKKKLKVIVKIFERNAPLELNFMQVERI